jgi:sugar phosphate isomerase/epimerase
LISDRDPRAVGVYYDIGHSTLEGSAGGWRMDLDLVRDRLVMAAVKSMIWEPGERAENGRRTWDWKVVPLSDGLADIPAFFELLNRIPFAGPVSFHSEYELKGDPLVEQTRRDLAFARPFMEKRGGA